MNFNNKSPEYIKSKLAELHPELPYVSELVRERVPFIKREVREYEAWYLYHVAKNYNHSDTLILEIGTAWGYSAAFLASACPKAHIITLNPKITEFAQAKQNLLKYTNVTPINYPSEVFYEKFPDMKFSFVFVDGGHTREHLERDILFWEKRTTENAGVLFHDYSPKGSGRPLPAVYHWVNEYAKKPFDYKCIANDKVGMVGWHT